MFGPTFDLQQQLTGLVNPACPINWGHPLNQNLFADWACVPNAGMRGGNLLPGLTRGGYKSTDQTLTNGPLWKGKSPIGGTLLFDGSNDYTTGSASDYTADLEYPLAIVALFRPSSVSSNQCIAAATNTINGLGYSLQITSAGKLRAVQESAYAESTSTLSAGVWYTAIAAFFDIIDRRIYLNGILEATDTSIKGGTGAGFRPFRIASGAFINNFQGEVAEVILYKAGKLRLSPLALHQEILAGNPNRWNWITRGTFFTQPSSPPPTSYILNLDPGSYTVTGANATLLANRVLDLSAGSYSITGASASLLYGYILTLESGSYSITGADATLLASRVLTLDSGSYSITGADASLLHNRVLSSDAGSYLITGAAATLLAARVLSLDPGSYSITGSDASLLANRVLTLDPGSYTITGASADLIYTQAGAYTLNLDPGSYAITGFAASLLANRLLSLDAGSYSVTGADATLAHDYPLTLDPGSYSITGSDASLVFARFLTLDPGSYTVTGYAATLAFSGAGTGFVIYAPPWTVDGRSVSFTVDGREVELTPTSGTPPVE